MYLIVSSPLCVKSDLSFTKLIITLFLIWSTCIIIQLRPLVLDVPIYVTLSDTECIFPYSWTLMSCCIDPWRWLFLYTSRYQSGHCFNNTFICLYLWYSLTTRVANSGEQNCNLHWIMSLDSVEVLEPGECDMPEYNLTIWTALHLCCWLFIVYLPEEDFFSSVPTIYAFEQCIVLWTVPCACINIDDMREDLHFSTQTLALLSGICWDVVLYKLSLHYLCITRWFFLRFIVSRQWDSWPCPKHSLWIGVVALIYFDRI